MRKIDTAKIWNLQAKTEIQSVRSKQKFVHFCVCILYDHLYSLLLFELSLSHFLLFFLDILQEWFFRFLEGHPDLFLECCFLSLMRSHTASRKLKSRLWGGLTTMTGSVPLSFFSIRASFTALAVCWLSNTVNLL